MLRAQEEPGNEETLALAPHRGLMRVELIHPALIPRGLERQEVVALHGAAHEVRQLLGGRAAAADDRLALLLSTLKSCCAKHGDAFDAC